MKFKILVTACFLVLVGNYLFAQSDSSSVWSYELKDEAWKSWDSIQRTWMKDIYFPCLKENKLKMSCGSCVYIYIDAKFTINNEGKLIDIQILKENICTKKASAKLKKCFFEYYQNLVFPPSLRNKKIKAKFGTGLTC
jgi:hypothetical protein